MIIWEKWIYSSGFPTVVESLEKEFSKYNNINYTLRTNSGTSALHAAYFAIGISRGDEVIVPTLTFYATATPLFQLSAVPGLADCVPDTFYRSLILSTLGWTC